jgi:hypothetical protein
MIDTQYATIGLSVYSVENTMGNSVAFFHKTDGSRTDKCFSTPHLAMAMECMFALKISAW